MALIVQILLLGACLTALWLFISNFPYPSPLAKPLLPPQKRWPEAQVRGWAQHGGTDKGFLKFFTRDPERTIPAGGNLIAPADGLLREMFVRGRTRYLVIALTFWDMHVQRSPVAGVVARVEDAGDIYADGEGRDMAFLREKKRPVQKVITLKSPVGPVRVRLITSFSARRLESWVHEGQTVAKGQRIGRILMGSTVVLELPATIPLAVEAGQRMVAGETVIAEPSEQRAGKRLEAACV